MTIQYHIKVSEHGQILQTMVTESTGHDIPDQVELLPEEFEIIRLPINRENHYWNGGLIRKSNKPSNNHKFDYVSKTWIDPRTLDDVKLEKWKAIKFIRDNEINAPITTPYGIFDGDSVSKQKITELLTVTQIRLNKKLKANVKITLYDNTVVTLTGDQLLEVGLIFDDTEQVIRNKATGLRTTIYAATTIEQVNNVVW